jgi:hypothetical protein
LGTIYGTEDLTDFLEVMAVNAYNRKKILDKDK